MNDDLLSRALKRYQDGVDADRDNRDRDEEDRAFYAGEQWNRSDLELRRNRPTLTINRLPQFVKQVTGEMRQNKPAIRILPVDEKTDPELAKVYTAIVRHIESLSDAHRKYAKAGEQAVIGGIAWLGVLTDYVDDKSFDQEAMIRHIRNPLSVVDDPDADELTGSNRNWLHCVEDMTHEAFRAKYPKASLTGFPHSDGTSPESQGWYSQDMIRVAEYWERQPYQRELFLLSDGSTRYADEEVDPAEMLGLEVIAKREVTAYRVKCYKMTAIEVLEEFDWPGQIIPFARVVGEEVELAGEVYRHGLIHFAKDSQRSYNFSRSAMLEHVASQPKAPYLATAAMLKNHKRQWQNLNVDNPPVLLYDADPQLPGARPQRESPPTMPSAWYQEAMVSDGDMKATTGIYDASLGNRSNEQSGVAIRAREAQGDTGTFVYIDNLTAAIKQIGRILLEVIPLIYTGERIVRIMGEDDTIEGFAKINGMLPDGSVFNDISQGQFDLEVSTGPAFATKRQEMLEYLMQLVQAVPNIGALAGDYIVKSLDMPNGDKMAERLQIAMLPPGVDEEADVKRAQAQMRTQQIQQQLQQAMGGGQPDPMQLMAMEQMKAQLQELAAKIQKMQAETAKTVAETEQTQVETALMPGKAELEAVKTGFSMGS